ncbi:MAG: hypothetical protein ACJA2G_003532 [Cognaticolwellia sp.]|jgi:hypothetical protein
MDLAALSWVYLLSTTNYDVSKLNSGVKLGFFGFAIGIIYRYEMDNNNYK